MATDLELSTKIDAAEELAAGLCSNYATPRLFASIIAVNEAIN